jgi:pyridoxamine 5'-phosphate oxidase family protein
LRAGNDKVALLIDDMESIQPWKPRGIRIYGTADFVERAGQFGPGTYMRISPEVSWSWDLVGPALVDGKFQSNKINHSS